MASILLKIQLIVCQKMKKKILIIILMIMREYLDIALILVQLVIIKLIVLNAQKITILYIMKQENV